MASQFEDGPDFVAIAEEIERLKSQLAKEKAEVAQRDAVRAAIDRLFGFDGFLSDDQEAAVDAVLAGRDVLAMLPTGGGKSLIYQLASLARTGVGVVVSPLLSLVADQLYGLPDAVSGIAYHSLDGDEDSASTEKARIRREIRDGLHKIVYTTPEQLVNSEPLRSALSDAGVAIVAIDEAHCISEWGPSFRTDYAQLGLVRRMFPGVPIVAVTATGTEVVLRDVVDKLDMNDPVVLKAPVDRPNLHFAAKQRRGIQDAITFIRAHPGQSGIVYCSTTRQARLVTRALRGSGIPAEAYYSGWGLHAMSQDEKRKVHEDFRDGAVQVVVATSAFGMGIDKADVRFVLNWNLPTSVEEYYQMAGRAGRDRMPADCLLLWDYDDVRTWQYLKADQHRLNEILAYAKHQGCRRQFLLSHFGDEHEGCCAGCDRCLDANPELMVAESANDWITSVDVDDSEDGSDEDGIGLLLAAATEIGEAEVCGEPPHVDAETDVDADFLSDEAAVFASLVVPTPASQAKAGKRQHSRAHGYSHDPIKSYLRAIGEYRLLRRSEEVSLAMRIEAGNEARLELEAISPGKGASDVRSAYLRVAVRRGGEARARMINSNLRLVVSIAKRYVGRGLELLDLIQEGNLGLMRAVEKYDYTLGYRFSTYATWWIRQSITRAIADKGRAIRIPVHAVETLNKMLAAERRLEGWLGRQPTAEEIAEDLGTVSAEHVCELMAWDMRPTSLDITIGEDDQTALGELIPDHATLDPLESALAVDLAELIASLLGDLTDRERRIIELRFGLLDGRKRTLEEVGREYGVTRERIRQIEAKALAKLKHPKRVMRLAGYVE